MKILVDKLPKNTEECPFARYDPEYGCPLCMLNDFIICDLFFHASCGHLAKFPSEGDVKND